MRNIIAMVMLFSCWVVGAAAAAKPPVYVDDPFGDADFGQAPLILSASQPLAHHAEVGLLFSTSMIDKYSSHLGGMIDLSYSLTETLGIGLSLGMLHGSLTPIVTDREGIIGNAVAACIDPEAGENCNSITPNVPDYKQITGVADLLFVWTPLYGKINAVSESDVNVHIFALAGFGINGTREVVALTDGQPASPSDYRLEGGGLLDGGAFGGTKFNGTAGVGIKLYLTDWMALRGEARGIFFPDAFEFEAGQGEQRYLSAYWLAQAGLSFRVF